MPTSTPLPAPARPSRRLPPFALVAVATLPLFAVASCSSKKSDTAPPPSGTNGVLACAPATDCTVHVSAGGDDVQTRIQTALIESASGSVICFDDGVYAFTDQLSVTKRGITIRGTSCNAVWDFRAQRDSAPSGLLATGDDFTIANITVKNTVGDGLRFEGSANLNVNHVSVLWEDDALRPDDAGVPRSGAYAIYPVTCEGVLVDTCEVQGARDAALYVGQSKRAVVRNNLVHGNVAGVEIENSQDTEVYGNHAWDNTAGILVFDLPDLPTQDGRRSLVHDNVVDANNRANFAIPGQIVAGVPAGLGVVVMAASQTEIRNNTITNNASSGVFILSCFTQNGLKDCTSSVPYDQFPKGTYVHDNTFSGNGTAPASDFALITTKDGLKTLEDILWDGDVDPQANGDPNARQCIVRNGTATYREFDARHVGATMVTDLSTVACDLPALSPISL